MKNIIVILVSLKMCIFKDCETQPTFGKKGTKKREYCKEHAPVGYVNVVDKQCLDSKCETRPSFGKKGTKNSEYRR